MNGSQRFQQVAGLKRIYKQCLIFYSEAPLPLCSLAHSSDQEHDSNGLFPSRPVLRVQTHSTTGSPAKMDTGARFPQRPQPLMAATMETLSDLSMAAPPRGAREVITRAW